MPVSTRQPALVENTHNFCSDPKLSKAPDGSVSRLLPLSLLLHINGRPVCAERHRVVASLCRQAAAAMLYRIPHRAAEEFLGEPHHRVSNGYVALVVAETLNTVERSGLARCSLKSCGNA